jgi:hypothetical protein
MISTKVMWGKNPLEKWSGIKPLVRYLRTFGCMVWFDILDDKKNKLN